MIRRYFFLCAALGMMALLVTSCEDPASIDPDDADNLSELRPNLINDATQTVAVNGTSVCVEVFATDPNDEPLTLAITNGQQLGDANTSTSGCSAPLARPDHAQETATALSPEAFRPDSAKPLKAKAQEATATEATATEATATEAIAEPVSKTAQDNLVGSINYVVRADIFNGSEEVNYLVRNSSGYQVGGTLVFSINRQQEEPPGPPSLTQPANNATEVTTTPTFSWSTVADADSYVLQVATSQDFSTGVALNRPVNGTSYTLTENEELNTGTTYFWHVRSVSTTAGEGPFSPTRTFTTTATPPPSVPILVAPEPDAQDVALLPILIWQQVSGAEGYDVQVAQDNDTEFTDPVFEAFDVTATAVVVEPTLEAGTTYRWHVRSKNTFGVSSYSDSHRFTTRQATAENQPPTVAITSPTEGATFDEGQNITITATASDDDGSVTQVEFFEGANSIGTDSDGSDGFSATLTNPTPGTYRITAEATDDDGASTTSAPVTVTVQEMADNQPPTVSITSPANGATFDEGQNITITATANDADGTVAQVAFTVNDALIATDTNGNDGFSATLPNPAPGTYRITAEATDDDGASTTSAPVTVTVQEMADNQPPTVSITSPANGATFDEGQNITITATANDPDGTIAQVTFLRGSTVIGIDTSAPYQATFTNPPPGTYALTARATDNDGASTTSVPITVTVQQDTGDDPPTTPPTLRTPSDGATVASTTPTLQWNSVPNATSYDVRLDATEANVTTSNAMLQQTVSGTSFTIPPGTLQAGVTYFWSVRGRNGGGPGPFAAPFEFTVPIPPGFTITPITGSFGQVRVNTASPREYRIRNNGSGTLSGIISLSGDNAFSITSGGGEFSLTSGNEHSFIVTFAPETIEAFSATLSITHNGTNMPSPFTMNLQGTGVEAPPTYDLAITKTASATDVNAGAPVTFTVAVTNHGPDAAEGVEVEDPLPAGLTYVSHTQTQGTYTPGSGLWTVGNLASEAKATLTLEATATATVTNTATITAGLAQEGDNPGNNSANVGVTVNQPPTVEITSPAEGATFTEGDDVVITAEANDADGTITQVEFFEGANSIGTDSDGSDGFTATLSNPGVGSYTLTAVATDNDGVTSISAPVNITVAANQPPTVEITSPANGATFTEGDDVNITATASDADGTVTQVEFFEGANSLGTDSDGSDGFTATLSNPGVGSYALTAVATDDDGAMTTSDPVNITVNAGNTPPTANDDTATTDEDNNVGVVIFVLDNDTDPDGSLVPATVMVTSAPSNGTTSVNSTTGAVTYKPVGDFFGNDSFTYTVQDDGGAVSNEAIVTITVNAVNDAPGFTPGGNQSASFGDAEVSVAGWATGFEPNASNPGDPNESGQSIADFVVSLQDGGTSDCFATAPDVANDGTLTFTPAGTEPAVDCTTIGVDVTVQDNGGTANGGEDTSAVATFQISID